MKTKRKVKKQGPNHEAMDRAQNGPSPEDINTMIAFINQRRYAEGEKFAKNLTTRFPQHGFGWQVLGVIHEALGRNEEALLAMQQAAGLLPDDEHAHYNLGNAFKDVGRLPEAEESYRRALHINPNFWEAYYNLGITLKALGKFHETEDCYRRTLQIKPDFPEAHYNLSNLLKDLGRLAEAEEGYRRALEIKPDYAQAHHNLANTLKEIGRLAEAEDSYRLALLIKPNYADAHCNLGNLLKNLGRTADAEACYRHTLQINPDYLDALYALGNILVDQGQFTYAEACYRRALEIKPDCTGPCYNLGNIFNAQGRFTEAETCYRLALKIDPDCVEAYDNLLFCLNYIPGRDVSNYLEEARRFGQIITQKVEIRYSSWSCNPNPQRLRVGMVSGDLRNHPVGYFLENILKHINSSRIELIAYSTNNKTDELTDRIKPYFSEWKTLVGLSEKDAANLIHTDGTHILLDLAGHTSHNGLPIFAWKPAPVQVSWLGYMASTGVQEIDYLLGDPYNTPKNESVHFTENIWSLPESRLCFTPPDFDLDVAPLPAKTAGFVTFGCFNNLTKINDAVIALWAKILLAIPSSRLYLKAKQLSDPLICVPLQRRFTDYGIASSRLMLKGLSPRKEYLEAYNLVDINLDPFPFPGGTTSVEGLWMGVPLITLRGDRLISHQGEGILHNIGMSDWIAENKDEYIVKAVKHATNLENLSSLRARLRGQVLASPLFDAPRFARHLEEALWGMWEKRFPLRKNG